MTQTIGHSARHGGLRGHSINPDIYPYMVVAKGNPHESGGLRWYVRCPDGSFTNTVGYATASLAYAMACKAKREEA
jgi:hypothetical protein